VRPFPASLPRSLRNIPRSQNHAERIARSRTENVRETNVFCPRLQRTPSPGKAGFSKPQACVSWAKRLNSPKFLATILPRSLATRCHALFTSQNCAHEQNSFVDARDFYAFAAISAVAEVV